MTNAVTSNNDRALLRLVEGAAPPETTAQRIQRLQAEAKSLAMDEIYSLESALRNAAHLAYEIANGGDAYAVGARELSSRLIEDLLSRAETLKIIASRSGH